MAQTGQSRVWRQPWLWSRSAVEGFFFGTEQDIRRYRDPFMDMVAENPVGSMQFARGVIHVAAVSSAGSALPSAAYVWRNWRACAACDQPLRWWLSCNCILAIVQIPLRIAFYFRLRYLSGQRIDVMTAGVNRVTSSRAWCLSKTLSFLGYISFGLGVIWTLTARHCPEARFLIPASLSVIISSVTRLILTLASFYYYIPAASRSPARAADWRGAGLDPDNLQGILRPVPLERKQLEAIPTELYVTAETRTPSENCSICLSLILQGDTIRKLPVCDHLFHQLCIDQWLIHCGACPLCQRQIR